MTSRYDSASANRPVSKHIAVGTTENIWRYLTGRPPDYVVDTVLLTLKNIYIDRGTCSVHTYLSSTVSITELSDQRQ